jgi:hypothetical protein
MNKVKEKHWGKDGYKDMSYTINNCRSEIGLSLVTSKVEILKIASMSECPGELANLGYMADQLHLNLKLGVMAHN